jgi:hypothetical protein
MTVMVETLALVADGTEVGGADLTDDELTDLALSTGSEQPLDPDAVPLELYSSQSAGFLPMWYMPPVVARAAGGWRRPLVFVLIAAFLAIDGFGLCITYGQLVAA